MIIFLPIITAYILGSIPFGLIVCRLAGVEDIRKFGSGNIGATNVWRASGFKVAVFVYIGDIGKGVLSILFAQKFAMIIPLGMAVEIFYVICAVACVLGAVYSIFIKFKGGKGVNAALGVLVMLLPFEILIAFILFLLSVIIFRYISLGSIVAAFSLAVTLAVEIFILGKQVSIIYFYLCLILVLMILITHRSNIKRIINGTESRFSFSSKTREVNAGV
jgi:glycerol-3-phosphate acyltransferase PlsY